MEFDGMTYEFKSAGIDSSNGSGNEKIYVTYGQSGYYSGGSERRLRLTPREAQQLATVLAGILCNPPKKVS